MNDSNKDTMTARVAHMGRFIDYKPPLMMMMKKERPRSLN